MTKNHRVLNVTRGYSMKRGAAEKAIRECSATWVEYGISVRNLTIAEAITARNEQARLREPLAFAEVHGLRFDPPASGIAATKREGKLLWAAHDFVMNGGSVAA